MSILERCPSYKESNKRSKEKTGNNSRCPFYGGVLLIEVSVKKESTVVTFAYSRRSFIGVGVVRFYHVNAVQTSL